jgi:hypothetical protein
MRDRFIMGDTLKKKGEATRWFKPKDREQRTLQGDILPGGATLACVVRSMCISNRVADGPRVLGGMGFICLPEFINRGIGGCMLLAGRDRLRVTVGGCG